MKYRSTRGQAQGYTFEEAVMAGLSPDGGLFIPHSVPQLPTNWRKEWANKSFEELAVALLSLYIDQSEIPTKDLEELVKRSYSTFRHEERTPLANIRDGLYVLELFHGPTFAFKDVALQFVGNLFEYFLERRNRNEPAGGKVHRLTVVGATSGDTGSAAIYGLRNKKNVSVFILHPNGRVSPIQEAQMTTVLDKNVHNLAVEGTFDDCQDIVKTLFGNKEFNERHHLGAVNSINWARILVQTVYYFQAYFGLLRSLKLVPGSPEAEAINVHFSVPTGNFGDVLAGYFAHRMGLPTHKLLVATNANDILYRFFETNAYEKQTGADGNVKETLSPAMDILLSSNFERLLWYLARETVQTDEQAGQTVAGWMQALKTSGSFKVNDEVVLKARALFDAAMVTDEQTIDTIRTFYKPTTANQKSYVLDPHTAVGVAAAEKIIKRDNLALYPSGPEILICLATAHPAKFSGAVETALKSYSDFDFEKNVLPTEFIGLLDKPKSVVSVERADPALIIEVIEKELRQEGVSF
ncbi:threonine synthase [Phycomyces nitens]|nr:threonine synthase [Phycomyces nitens]